MLLPHDWRDGRGAVRASVAVTGRDGRRVRAVVGVLRSASATAGVPAAYRSSCRLPAWTTSLRLSACDPGRHQHRAVARGDLAGTDHHRPITRRPPPRRASPHPRPACQRRSDTPLISVLTPVHDPPLADARGGDRLRPRADLRPDWELCLVDDGSTDPEIIAALQRHAAADPRIHLTRREQAGGISTATNTALEIATGTVHRAARPRRHPHPRRAPARRRHDRRPTRPRHDLQRRGRGRRRRSPSSRHLKPGWSPESMAALMYTCHVGVYRRSLAVDLGRVSVAFRRLPGLRLRAAPG